MLTQQSKLSSLPGHALLLVVALAVVATLGACGGSGEEAVVQELTAQQQREAAALKRAHQLNAEAMSKSNIKSERAARSTQNN